MKNITFFLILVSFLTTSVGAQVLAQTQKKAKSANREIRTDSTIVSSQSEIRKAQKKIAAELRQAKAEMRKKLASAKEEARQKIALAKEKARIDIEKTKLKAKQDVQKVIQQERKKIEELQKKLQNEIDQLEKKLYQELSKTINTEAKNPKTNPPKVKHSKKAKDPTNTK